MAKTANAHSQKQGEHQQSERLLELSLACQVPVWIPRIKGDYFNVAGLPLAATVRLLRQLGFASSAQHPAANHLRT